MHASLTIEEYRALTAKPRAGRAAKGKPVSQEGNFAFQCRAQQLPEMIAQYRFPQSKHPNSKRRVWIADFAFLESKVMVEIDGGIWIAGAHSHPLDVTRNMTKQNDAALLGFLTLRFTPEQVRDGAAVSFTQRILERREPRLCQCQLATCGKFFYEQRTGGAPRSRYCCNEHLREGHDLGAAERNRKARLRRELETTAETRQP